MSRTRVAAIITCGRSGHHVERALRAVLGQTPPPAETRVLDEGPIDVRTRQALARIEEAGHHVVACGHAPIATVLNSSIRAADQPLIVVVDAADLLEEDWLARTAPLFDRNPDLSFLRGAPDANAPRGTAERSMFRREMFELLGGFDEGLGACSWIDFWLRATSLSLRGEVQPHSGLPSDQPDWSIDPGAGPVECLERLYRKHATTLAELHDSVLVGKERLLLAERARNEQLTDERARLEREADRLQREIDALAGELRQVGRQRVELGDLRRTSPISSIWGLDRGMPLDRHYIHAFLNRHRLDIKGRVLEIKDPGYTRWFGDDRVSVSHVLDVDPGNQRATIVADLSRADAIADDTYDCFILTQTLGVIFDTASVLAHTYRILKPGGVLLCTAPAIGRLSFEEGLDGDYWRFTEASLRRLFAGAFPLTAFEITGFGNVLASAAFLYGLAPDELDPAELDEVDPYFPVVYGVRAVKPAAPASVSPGPSLHGTRHGQATTRSCVVLMYHRIASEQHDHHGLCVDLDTFSGHLRHLRDQKYRVLSLDDLGEALRADQVPERSVVITFDDGYLDVLTLAAPLLADFGMPARFFVIGSALDSRAEFWWEALPRVLLSGAQLQPRLRLVLPDVIVDVPTDTYQQRLDAHDRLAEIFYKLPAEPRDRAVLQLVAWSGLDATPSAPRSMNADELRSLARIPGMSIGAHTENHLWLPSQPPATQLDEIVSCKQRLERVLEGPVTSFSYPYGAHDEETVEIVRRAGFDQAVTTEQRAASMPVDPLRIPRFDARPWTIDRFGDLLRRAFEAVAR